MPTTGYYLSKALHYQTIGNSALAEATLAAAATDSDMLPGEDIEMATLDQFLRDYNAQFTSQFPWNFSNSFETKCENLATQTETKAGAYARNLLRFKNNEGYEIESPIDPVGIFRKKVIENNGSSVAENNFDLKVYPNPSNSYVHFEWKNLDETKENRIVLTYIDGRVVYEGVIEKGNDNFLFNTSSFASGVYIYSIRSNEEIYQSGKLIIKH